MMETLRLSGLVLGERSLDEYNPINFPYRFMGWLQEKQVHDMNVAMHNKLLALGIEHDYKPYGDGMHASAYWKRSLKAELPIIMEVFKRNNIHFSGEN